MDNTTAIAAIAIMAVITAALRGLPFILFSTEKDTRVSRTIAYLGDVLPAALMAMLVIYCLRTVSFTTPAKFAPELLAGGATVLLYVWLKNTLVAIVGGTAAYMVLVQFVF